MKAKVVDALGRGFGIFVFAIIVLWYFHRAFPSRWLALVALYVLCVPLAALYGLIVGPRQSSPDHSSRSYRVPGLLLIGVAVAAALVAHVAYEPEIGRMFYGSKQAGF